MVNANSSPKFTEGQVSADTRGSMQENSGSHFSFGNACNGETNGAQELLEIKVSLNTFYFIEVQK